MLDQKSFRELFYDALQIHQKEYSVLDNSIIKAISAIEDEYVPRNWNFCHSKPVNFNEPAFRCGYLHKFASLHASLVHYVARRLGPTAFVKTFGNVCVPKITCIGGGPGTEVIGLCAFFSSVTEFSNTFFHFDIVDSMIGWKTAFASVLEASFKYGSFGSYVSCATSTYLEADMLSHITNSVQESISTADLVTMVKFVSAAASGETPRMLTNVFTLMKPGASVLFIDNAGGEFYELVLNAACRCGFSSLCGPFRHLRYEHEAFRRKMFGTFGLSCTTVAVQMWEKKFLVVLNAHESHLISEVLLNLETSDLCGCPDRNPLNMSDSKPKKKRKRNRSKSRNRRAGSVCDNERSNSGERSLCDSAAEQPKKSQTFLSEVAHYNWNISSISEGRCSQDLNTGSNSCEIYADRSKIPHKQSPDRTSSTASEDFDTLHSSSESTSNGQYQYSNESHRSRHRDENDSVEDCCCIIS